MLTIKPCNTYHAVLRGRDICSCLDGKSGFKVYFIDILGRKEPARYEWAKCDKTPAAFLAQLARTDGVEGIGFVTAFPHITKVFRFGPESEIVLNVRAWNTRDFAPLDLTRGDGYVEFACLAEALIAAEEYNFWASAGTVEEYLAQWSTFGDGPVGVHDKLMKYWRA